MMPQAMVQPSAQINKRRARARPATATLSGPVKVHAMISPNAPLETGSLGSSTRCEVFGGSVIGRRRSPRRVDARCASFFFNDTATTEIYTLSLHDALPI